MAIATRKKTQNNGHNGFAHNADDVLALTGEASYDQINDALMIPVEALAPNPYQPRRNFNAIDLQDLSDSIKTLHERGEGVNGSGVLQAIIVRRAAGTIDKNGVMVTADYEILGGERRWRAAQMAGVTHIPAIVRDVSNEVAQEIALLENIQRVDLSAFEEGVAIAALMNLKKLSIRGVASYIKKSKGYVAGRLAMLKVNPDLRKLIDERPDTIRSVQAIEKVASASEKKKLMDMVRKKVSSREIEQRVKALKASETPVLSSIGSKKSEDVAFVAGFSEAVVELNIALDYLQRAEGHLRHATVIRDKFRKNAAPKLTEMRILLDKIGDIGSRYDKKPVEEA